MSLLLSGLLFLFIVILVSQFGGKLSAKSSVAWWLIFVFLLFCTLFPYALLPIAHLLGVQLVSNLVLASLVALLMFLAIQESVVTTSLGRRLRESVTSLAAKEFSLGLKMHADFQGAKNKKRVLILFPTYNEAPNLLSMFQSLSTVSTSDQFYYHFCFVSDGSRDDTDEMLESKAPTQSVSHSVNVGVAGAILTGFKILKRAHFDYVVQCDSDGQHPVHLIPSLVEKADTGQIDLLIGSRYLSSGSFQKHESSTFTRRLGAGLITFALKFFSSEVTVTDPTSGFRVYSKNAALYLINNMPDEYPEPESVALLMLANKKIAETPVAMLPRQEGVSSLAGYRSIQFMIKVMSALMGLRLRSVQK